MITYRVTPEGIVYKIYQRGSRFEVVRMYV